MHCILLRLQGVQESAVRTFLLSSRFEIAFLDLGLLGGGDWEHLGFTFGVLSRGLKIESFGFASGGGQQRNNAPTWSSESERFPSEYFQAQLP